MNATPSCWRAAIQACSGGSCARRVRQAGRWRVRQYVALAQRLHMHREDAQRTRVQMQRDVGAAAQCARSLAAGLLAGHHQRRGVGVDVVRQPAPHHQADALHHVVARHVDRVGRRREHLRGDLAAIDLLDGDDIGIELDCVLRQRGKVLGAFRVRILRQRAVAVRAGGQPFQVPGGDFQFAAARGRVRRMGRDRQEREHHRQQQQRQQHQRMQQPAHSRVAIWGAAVFRHGGRSHRPLHIRLRQRLGAAIRQELRNGVERRRIASPVGGIAARHPDHRFIAGTG